MGLLMGLELGMEERLVGCRGLDSTLQLDREGISDDEKKKKNDNKKCLLFLERFFLRGLDVGRDLGFLFFLFSFRFLFLFFVFSFI